MELQPKQQCISKNIEMIDHGSPGQKKVDQRFVDEINKYGRIVSVEEFLRAAKESMT